MIVLTEDLKSMKYFLLNRILQAPGKLVDRSRVPYFRTEGRGHVQEFNKSHHSIIRNTEDFTHLLPKWIVLQKTMVMAHTILCIIPSEHQVCHRYDQ